MMSDNKFNMIPITESVKAAIVDTYEELPRVEERYTSWAIRIIRELNRKTLKYNKMYAKISISPTGIVKLPLDLKEPLWQGFEDDCGRKVQIDLATDIWPKEEEKLYYNCCRDCGQSASICEKLNQEIVSVVTPENVIGASYPYGGPIGVTEDIVWTKTETRTLAPEGGLIIETVEPVYDIELSSFSMRRYKIVETIEIYDCGCPVPSPKNKEVFKCHCTDVYSILHTGCEDECELGFQYFLDAGYGKVTGDFQFKYILMEYNGDIPTKDGYYMMPEVAFEAVVEGIKHYRIRDKKTTPSHEKNRVKKSFEDAVRTMNRQMGPKLSIQDIYNLFSKPPRP